MIPFWSSLFAQYPVEGHLGGLQFSAIESNLSETVLESDSLRALPISAQSLVCVSGLDMLQNCVFKCL
jgi:hypothetical protein